MHELNSDEKELLGLLLNETPRSDAGVDCLAFRAKNYEQITLIDRLESEGYIRKDQDRYFVSLTALIQMSNEVADRILQNAERLFDELRHHYKAAQREAIQVDALAEQAGVDPLAARETLSYMVEGTWWGGRSTSFFSHPDPHIQPSETILRFERFGDVINQLRSWQAARIRDRRSALASALLQYSSPLTEFERQTSNFQRQRPDWFDQLPESLRDLLAEIYTALAQDLRALPAMGARAVIDVVCIKLVGDSGSFERKLKLLREGGHISEVERAILAAAVDAGSASAHRGHVPSRGDLTTLLDIVEHLLQAQYILPNAVERMKSNTPSRPARQGNAL